MGYTGITVHGRFGEGAESYLVLSARTLPRQFYHTLIKDIVEGE